MLFKVVFFNSAECVIHCDTVKCGGKVFRQLQKQFDVDPDPKNIPGEVNGISPKILEIVFPPEEALEMECFDDDNGIAVKVIGDLNDYVELLWKRHGARFVPSWHIYKDNIKYDWIAAGCPTLWELKEEIPPALQAMDAAPDDPYDIKLKPVQDEDPDDRYYNEDDDVNEDSELPDK